MSTVHIIGPRGVGKSALLAECQITKSINHPNFVDATKLELNKEDEHQGRHYIEGGIIDILVQAVRQRKVPLPKDPLKRRLDDNEAKTMLYSLCKEKNEIQTALRRYRESLVVLVNPFESNKSAENEIILYRQILSLLRVPFIDLLETDMTRRIVIFKKASEKNTYASPLASLLLNEKLTSNPKKKEKQKEVKEEIYNYYHQINLPFWLKASSSDCQLKCLTISESEVVLSIECPNKGRTNRFLEKRGGSKDLFVVEFKPTVPSSMVFEVLQDGVLIQGDLYSFLGCSSSGLKARKCYLLKGTPEFAEQTRQQHGDFHKIKGVSKELARFSLLLTNVVPTKVEPANIIEEDDVERNGSNFTDGCGCVSPDLADKLYRDTKKVLRRAAQRAANAPSVFQIRHQGNKGIVIRDSTLAADTLVVRPSMRKFPTNQYPHICVCDFSRPYSFGHLNRQFICLLSGLGVPDEVFLTLQQEHFERVQKMLYDRDAALMILEWKNRASELIEGQDTVAHDHAESDYPVPYRHLKSLQRQLIEESKKLKLLVPESRTLFGVSERPRLCPKSGVRLSGLLKHGECMVRVTMHGGRKVCLQGQRVLVSKNPCYLLGDVRVLKAVSSLGRPELKALEADLVDCIVFPIEGERPHSEEIAGSDLDGDQYFVCWDKRLVPPKDEPPYHYPAYKGNSPAKVGHLKEMVRYFAGQNKVSALMGKVDNLFKAWANKKGGKSHECLQLGQLFSRAVDSAKSGERIVIKPALLIPKDEQLQPTIDSKFVWQRMDYIAGQFMDEQAKRGNLDVHANARRLDENPKNEENTLEDDDYSDDRFVLYLVSRNHLSMSEYTKFCLIMQHLQGDIDAFFRSEFVDYVNFALLKPSECDVAVTRYSLPLHIIQNALRFYSQIVGSRTKFIDKYVQLPGEKDPWKYYWRSNRVADLDLFPRMITDALRKNTDVLLILELPDSVVVLLRFTRTVLNQKSKSELLTEDGRNGCCEESIKGFLAIASVFISGHFDYVEEYALEDPNYKMDLSSKGLQLYRSRTGNTFIHVKVAGGLALADFEDEGLTPKLQVSVDLNRFNRRMREGTRPHPLVRKVQVFGMEMFVSNKRSEHSTQPARLSHLDILIDDAQGWTFTTVSDLLEDEDLDDDIMKHFQDGAHMILKAICDQFSDVDGLSYTQELLELFESTVLDPAHQLFGVTPRWPAELKHLLASVSMKLFKNVLPNMDEDPKVELTSLLGKLSDLDVDVPELPPLLPSSKFEATRVVVKFIQVVRRWDFWMALGTSQKRNQVLTWLESTIKDDTLYLADARVQFAFRNAREQARILLEEMADASDEDARSNSSVSRLVNLCMDPVEPDSTRKQQPQATLEEDQAATRQGSQKAKKKLPIVSLYCVQTIPMSVRFATGEYVCISRHVTPTRAIEDTKNRKQSAPSADNYDVDFPSLKAAREDGVSPLHRLSGAVTSKRRGLCLGRVVNVCEVPFSIQVKLLAPSYAPHSNTPDLIQQCLQQQKRIYWEISMVPVNVVAHMRNMDAIAAFLEGSTNNGDLFVAPELLPYLMPVVGPAKSREEEESTAVLTDQGPKLCDDFERLNSRQQQSVLKALASRVSLVHGPPGTGKTTTAVQTMREILANTDEDHKILVVAETNLAVDNLAIRFLKYMSQFPHGQAIRVGGQGGEKVDPKLHDIHLEVLVKGTVRSSQNNNAASAGSSSSYVTVDHQDFYLSRYKKIIGDLLGGARIVFTTCAGAGDPILNGQRFESVIMDESSMTTEPSALCALAHGCRHLVMIGDHKQLGPHANRGKCISLFERLTVTCIGDGNQDGKSSTDESFNSHYATENMSKKDNAKPSVAFPAAMTMLDEQHRMHPQLCLFPSDTFYQGKLHTAPGLEKVRPVPKVVFGGKCPLKFVAVQGGREERHKSGSWFNMMEVQQALKILQELVTKGGISASDITVLTPYKAQQTKMQVALKSSAGNSAVATIEVCSVDGFQGRENDIILVSTVRCGPSLGFCDDERRVNVLLTRAKRGLIIVGDPTTLKRSALWSKWLQKQAEAVSSCY